MSNEKDLERMHNTVPIMLFLNRPKLYTQWNFSYPNKMGPKGFG